MKKTLLWENIINRMNNSQTEGFTLTEVLITILVLSIVISAILININSVSKLVNNIVSANTSISSIAMTEKRMNILYQRIDIPFWENPNTKNEDLIPYYDGVHRYNIKIDLLDSVIVINTDDTEVLSFQNCEFIKFEPINFNNIHIGFKTSILHNSDETIIHSYFGGIPIQRVIE